MTKWALHFSLDEKGADGTFRQFQSVGGQGVSISKYSKNPDEAWKFMEWFMSKDNQWKWVKAGAQTGRKDVMADPEYSTFTTLQCHLPNCYDHRERLLAFDRIPAIAGRLPEIHEPGCQRFHDL